MAVLQEYKCPCCDGAIEFDSTSQKMKCPYCGSEFEIETLKAYDAEINSLPQDNMTWDISAGQEWTPGESEGLRVYSCNTCGGEIVADETTGASECPFCGNPVVMTGQFEGVLKPDLVIPFKIDKKTAIAKLQELYKGKRLLPKIFRDENRINEIKGVYVPFWLYDTDSQASIRYKATRVRVWSDSNYNYTETSYFLVRRGGTVGFEKVPVDGTTKMDDTLMESLEPFDCSKAVPFHTGYLSGYLADKYDVTSEDSIARANQRIKKSTEEVFADTVVGYSSVVPESSSVAFQNGTAKYALFPVWLLNTTWKGKNYHFAMNGQTGRFVGDLPMDKSALTRWFLGIFGAVSAACGAGAAIAYLLGEKQSNQELYRQVADTITNTIGTVGGMVCDGAKSSCAAKIATAVDCAITAYELSRYGNVFQPGEGLVMESVEDTIESVGRMGREGMHATDLEILQIMLREE